MNWKVYIIHCSDNSYYTGITNNIEKRYQDHCNGKGAKYFRGRKPVEVVFVEEGHSRSTASKREFAIKKLSHIQKEQLILQHQ